MYDPSQRITAAEALEHDWFRMHGAAAADAPPNADGGAGGDEATAAVVGNIVPMGSPKAAVQPQPQPRALDGRVECL
jgi:hypothetical protein